MGEKIATSVSDRGEIASGVGETIRLEDLSNLELETDEVLSVLSHRRRRFLLSTLANGSADQSLDDLATKLIAWEGDKAIAEITDEEHSNACISLYHNHVPRLATLDLIEYEREDDEIVCSLNPDRLDAVLDI